MKKLLTRSLIGLAAIAHLPNLLQGAMAPAHAASTPDGPGLLGELSVYDAAGKPAGQYSNGAAVLSAGDGRLFVRLGRIATGRSSNSVLAKWDPVIPTPKWWLSADCSGPPYVIPVIKDFQFPEGPRFFSYSGEPGERPAVFMRDASGDLIAYIAPSGPTALQPYHSMFEGDQCVQRSGMVRAWTAEKSVNVTRLYPEPLTVRRD